MQVGTPLSSSTLRSSLTSLATHAGATAARDTVTLLATTRHDPSAPPPWPACRVATVWTSLYRAWVQAVVTTNVRWHAAGRNCGRCATRPPAGANRPRPCTACWYDGQPPPRADGYPDSAVPQRPY